MPGREGDEDFMRVALDEAALGDLPFGAVVTRDGALLARGRNRGRSARDPTAHAEMEALRAVIAAGRAERLRGATLYATGEPCAMCMGASLWCGIDRLVYGASIPRLAEKLGQIEIGARALAAAAPFAAMEIEGGLLADEALALFDARRRGEA
ncbi:nucleoside deaminase [Methylocella sp.]|uniref:nucleoside deaminase n=1 Tax=Methylocella sp. TaxID=1978226 RepID=UPI0037830D88